jgi:hypothetical protein
MINNINLMTTNSRCRRMNIFATKVLFFLVIAMLLIETPLKSNPLAVAGVIATAGAAKSMLSNLIEQTNGELQETLKQSLNGINLLESDIMEDLEGLENATMEDLDKITQNRLAEFNTMLESTLAMIMQLETSLNIDMAIRVKASIAEASATWLLISQDIDNKILKTTKGIYLTIDNASIQVLRIVVVICAFVLIISAIFILRKHKIPGYISLFIGVIVLIFVPELCTQNTILRNICFNSFHLMPPHI